MRLLGGELDGKGMRVAGMPRFKRGEEMILFVRGNGQRVCPVMGWRYGQFRVEQADGGGSTRVLRADSSPVLRQDIAEAAAVGVTDARRTMAADQATALSATDFLNLVRRERAKEVAQ